MSKNIIGKKFNRLTVLTEIEKLPGNKNRRFECICDCGNKHSTTYGNLVCGYVKSCGCYRIECGKIKRSIKHGQSYSKAYSSWSSMKERCLNKKHSHYKDYGGRGIKICERWINSFENFLADMGNRPEGKTLERKNNNMGYMPENCIWASRKTQARNRRSNRVIIFNGISKTASDWSEETGIKRSTIRERLNRGWSIGKALGYV